jgi:hypothetical protein
VRARPQPTFKRLGIPYDARAAQALLRRKPGAAAKLLSRVRDAVAGMDAQAQVRAPRARASHAAGLRRAPQPAGQLLPSARAAASRQTCSPTLPSPRQALDHTGRTLRDLAVRQPPSAGLLEAARFRSTRGAHEASAGRAFDAAMRKGAASPNRLMETAHLKPFYDGARAGRGRGAARGCGVGVGPQRLWTRLRGADAPTASHSPSALLLRHAEGERQVAAVEEARARARADRDARHAAGRERLRDALATNAQQRSQALQRDAAVHAALLRRKVGGRAPG